MRRGSGRVWSEPAEADAKKLPMLAVFEPIRSKSLVPLNSILSGDRQHNQTEYNIF